MVGKALATKASSAGCKTHKLDWASQGLKRKRPSALRRLGLICSRSTVSDRSNIRLGAPAVSSRQRKVLRPGVKAATRPGPRTTRQVVKDRARCPSPHPQQTGGRDSRFPRFTGSGPKDQLQTGFLEGRWESELQAGSPGKVGRVSGVRGDEPGAEVGAAQSAASGARVSGLVPCSAGWAFRSLR